MSNTIPCLSPDEMRCTNCGCSEVDYLDFDHYDNTGEMLCLDCSDE